MAVLKCSDTQSDIMDTVVSEVSKEFGVAANEILGKKRHKNIIGARHVSWWLIRSLYKIPYSKIGDHFKRDHSTVMWGYQNVCNWIEIDDPDIADKATLMKRGFLLKRHLIPSMH